jgi:glycosyltransferase involved in cell wall biosynthesis
MGSGVLPGKRPQAPRAILYVISCLRLGGGERQLVEYLRALDRRRWRPLVACFERAGELLPALLEQGCDPLEFPLKGDLEQPNTAYQVMRLVGLCARQRVAIVHAYDFWANLLAVAAGRLALRPVVVSQLDQGHHLSPLQRRGQALARRLATCVVVNASALARQVIAEGTPARKVRVLSQGLDLSRFDRLTRPDPGLPPWPGPTVVTVANMVGPGKGHEDLLFAARRLPQVRLIFCGDGAYRRSLERRAAELGMAERVLFLGKRRDVAAIVARASCVCHPSHAEGLPNALLEALAAARPVVATAVGGIPELVLDGTTGLLVPPREPAALAAALRRLFDDPAGAAALGRAGRLHIERNYSLGGMTERHDRLYEDLCAKAASPWSGR